MQTIIKYILTTTLLAVLTSPTSAGARSNEDFAQRPAELRSLDRVDPRSIMDLVVNGRTDSALTILRSEENVRSSDPMVFLLTARAMRDQLIDEDDDKDLIKAGAEPILDVIHHCIELCDKALEHEGVDPIYYYYRGRAYLAKSQMHVLTHGYWSAGRAAANAKSDLEKFLELRPGHPDACGDLGAFLYFADSLPGVVKFISKMLFIPGGDRERGLELLRYATANDGIFVIDYQVALAAIDLVFEGYFERGTVAMEALIERYPYYTRLVEPFGVVAPFYPTRIREFERLEDRVIGRHMSRGNIDWSLVKRIQLHRSYLNMFFGRPQQAYFELASLVDNPVARPDWMLPLAMINLGYLKARSGDNGDARAYFEQVTRSERMSHFHDLAKRLIETVEKDRWKTVELKDLDFIAAIYDRDFAAAREGLAAYRATYGTDVLYHFYLGELELLTENFVASARAYQNCLDIEIEGGDQSYQMFASMRIGEIHGHEGRYKTAKEYYESAREYTHAGYLFDFLLNARTRFYELLDDGTLDVEPTLLLQNSMIDKTPPLTENQ